MSAKRGRTPEQGRRGTGSLRSGRVRDVDALGRSLSSGEQPKRLRRRRCETVARLLEAEPFERSSAFVGAGPARIGALAAAQVDVKGDAGRDMLGRDVRLSRSGGVDVRERPVEARGSHGECNQ